MAIDTSVPFATEADPLLPYSPKEAPSKQPIFEDDPQEEGSTDRCKLAWVVAVLVLFHTLYFGLMRMSALPKLVQYLVEIENGGNVSNKQAGEISADMWGRMASVQSLCGLIAEPLWGILSDTRGRKWALAGNAIGLLGSTSLFAYAAYVASEHGVGNGLPSGTWPLVWASVLVLGCSSSFLTVTSAAVSDVSPARDVSANFGLWGLALCIGSFLGPLLHNMLVSLCGTSSAAGAGQTSVLSWVAVLWAMTSATILAAMPETRQRRKKELLPGAGRRESEISREWSRDTMRTYLQCILKVIVLYTPTAMLCLINFMFGVGMEGFYTIYWFYMGHRGIETASTNTLYSAYSIAQGCVEAVLLRLLVHRMPETMTLLIGLASISVAFFGLSATTGLGAAGGSLAFLALGTGLTYPLLYGLTSRHIRDSQPEHMGVGMAAFRVVCILAEVTGQLSSSKLFHGLENKGVSWIVAGTSVGIGAVVCGLFGWYEWRTKRRTY